METHEVVGIPLDQIAVPVEASPNEQRPAVIAGRLMVVRRETPAGALQGFFVSLKSPF